MKIYKTEDIIEGPLPTGRIRTKNYGDISVHRVCDLAKFFNDLQSQYPGYLVSFDEDQCVRLISVRNETKAEQDSRANKAKNRNAAKLAKIKEKIKKLESQRDKLDV